MGTYRQTFRHVFSSLNYSYNQQWFDLVWKKICPLNIQNRLSWQAFRKTDGQKWPSLSYLKINQRCVPNHFTLCYSLLIFSWLSALVLIAITWEKHNQLVIPEADSIEFFILQKKLWMFIGKFSFVFNKIDLFSIHIYMILHLSWIIIIVL